MRRKIAVYCTGGTQLGFGHFFRSRAFVANAPANVEISLIAVINSADRKVFDSTANKVLCSNETEAENAITAFNPQILVLDTVYCSSGFFSAIRSKVQVIISISPVFNYMDRIDYLFSRNPDTPDIPNVRVYKGLQYAIFNEDCKQIPDEVFLYNLAKEPLPIGIAMGGGDAPNKTLRILKGLAQIDSSFTFWVLLGEGYRHSYQELVDAVIHDGRHEVILAKTNRSAWSILSNCSLGVFAGGLTTMEAIYAGLPSINIFEKEEHINVVGKQIFTDNIAVSVGLYNDDSIEVLREQLYFLCNNKSKLLAMREKSKGKVDKLGAFRIFEALGSIL